MALRQHQRPDSWETKTSGTAKYTTDLHLPGTLTARVLRSPHPHAEIRSINTSRAESLPGVKAVITAADLAGRRYIHLGEGFSDRRALASDRVRFVGEEVAAVAAETPEAAARAIELIQVEYKKLPASESPTAALRAGAEKLHQHADGNLALNISRTYGDIEQARQRSDTRISGSYRYAPATHLCMEPHSIVASWDSHKQRIDLWVSTQAPYFVRKEVANILELDIEQVHTHEVVVGGGFGAKAKAGTHEALAAALSIRTDRPVRLVLDRGEEFATTAKRHGFEIELTTGARRDGSLTYRDTDITVDNGAYNHSGPSVTVFATMLPGSLYRVEASEAQARLVYTNTQPGASFRGYGNAQMNWAMESQLDELAEELQIDPIDLRIKNAHVSGDETLTGWRLGSARLVECLERARDEIGWNEKRQLAGSGRGVGVAAAIHVSGANAFEHSEFSGAALDVNEDGSVDIRFAGSDAGTGQATLLRQIAAEELGVDFDDTSVTMMESDGTPMDLGAWSSRGTVWSGHAMANTAGTAAQALKEAAAEKFAAPPQNVRLEDGQAKCGEDAIDIGDLVALINGAEAGSLHVEGGYLTDVDKMNKVTGISHFSPNYAFAVQAVEVKVDYETGKVDVVDVVSVHDSGTALNPTSADGQIVGAVVMGIGAALGEEMIYEGGRLINPSFLEYAAPRPADVPTIRPIMLDAYDSAGPYGAKGLGEIGLVPTPAAVANAVAHATGVRVRDIPITPDKLLPLLRDSIEALNAIRRPSLWWTATIRALYPRGLFYVLHRWGTRFARQARPAPVLDLSAPDGVDEAIAQHRSDSAFISGGTDLLVAREQGLCSPVRLIDLSTTRSLADLSDGHEALTIGAGVKLEDLRRHTLTSGDNMLLEALDDLANHQIREMATVAGNLLQEKRCSFYRNGFSCYKRGGWTCPCYALLGEHRFHHAVIDAHRCQAVTPSDLATAFLALDADVTVSGRHESRRSVPIGDLYSGPGESVLAPDEILTSVIVPLRARRRQSAFEKLRLYAGDFAICSAAVSLEIDDGMVVDARVALGAIAPTPYRAKRTEQALIGTRLADGSSLDRAANAWAQDAYPLADNGWKVDAACGLIRSALRRLT